MRGCCLSKRFGESSHRGVRWRRCAFRESPGLGAAWAGFEVKETQFAASYRKEAAETPASSAIEEEARPSNEQVKRRGRPPGAGFYEAQDAPILEKMRQAIKETPGLSPTAAAARFVDEAAGGGTSESKGKRLVQRYSEKFGGE